VTTWALSKFGNIYLIIARRTINHFRRFFEFLQVFEDIGTEIDLTRVGQGETEYPLKFIHVHVIVLYEEYQVIEVGVQAAIQFAQGDAVGVSNEHFQISELTNTDDTFLIPFR
jgi:hypothetical protein